MSDESKASVFLQRGFAMKRSLGWSGYGAIIGGVVGLLVLFILWWSGGLKEAETKTPPPRTSSLQDVLVAINKQRSALDSPSPSPAAPASSGTSGGPGGSPFSSGSSRDETLQALARDLAKHGLLADAINVLDLIDNTYRKNEAKR